MDKTNYCNFEISRFRMDASNSTFSNWLVPVCIGSSHRMMCLSCPDCDKNSFLRKLWTYNPQIFGGKLELKRNIHLEWSMNIIWSLVTFISCRIVTVVKGRIVEKTPYTVAPYICLPFSECFADEISCMQFKWNSIQEICLPLFHNNDNKRINENKHIKTKIISISRIRKFDGGFCGFTLLFRSFCVCGIFCSDAQYWIS